MIQNSNSNEICYIFCKACSCCTTSTSVANPALNEFFLVAPITALDKKKPKQAQLKKYTYKKLQQSSCWFFFCLLWNAWNTIINNKTFTNSRVVDGRVNGETITSTAGKVSRTHSYINSNNELQRTHSMKLNSYLIKFFVRQDCWIFKSTTFDMNYLSLLSNICLQKTIKNQSNGYTFIFWSNKTFIIGIYNYLLNKR